MTTMTRENRARYKARLRAVRCDTCKAAAGKPCHAIGRRNYVYTSFVHAARHDAFNVAEEKAHRSVDASGQAWVCYAYDHGPLCWQCEHDWRVS